MIDKTWVGVTYEEGHKSLEKRLSPTETLAAVANLLGRVKVADEVSGAKLRRAIAELEGLQKKEH